MEMERVQLQLFWQNYTVSVCQCGVMLQMKIAVR